jgi:hypothetical protein
MFRENTEMLRKQFKQDSHNRERFNIITKVDKDIQKLLEILSQISFDINSESYDDKQFYKDKNDLNNQVYTLDYYVKSNHLFFTENEYEILRLINKDFMEFTFFDTTSGYETRGYVDKLYTDLTREFRKSLEL